MASAVPAAVNNFMTLATAVLPTTECTIVLSSFWPKYTAPLTFRIIGVSDDQEWNELGPNYKREEAFNIMGELTTWAGDQDTVTRMNDVWTYWNLLEVAVGNDPQLTGVVGGTGHAGAVRVAEFKNINFTPEASANGGSIGKITFSLACKQRITTLT